MTMFDPQFSRELDRLLRRLQARRDGRSEPLVQEFKSRMSELHRDALAAVTQIADQHVDEYQRLLEQKRQEDEHAEAARQMTEKAGTTRGMVEVIDLLERHLLERKRVDAGALRKIIEQLRQQLPES